MNANRFTTPYTYTTVSPNGMSCICGKIEDTGNTVRCNSCRKHQHKACIPDFDFMQPEKLKTCGFNTLQADYNANQRPWVRNVNYQLDHYECYECKPNRHSSLLQSAAVDCQKNKEAIRDLLAPAVWKHYCVKFSLQHREGEVEPRDFGVSWREGLRKLLYGMKAVEIAVLRQRIEAVVTKVSSKAGAGLGWLRCHVANSRWEDGRREEFGKLGVLAEVLGLREQGTLWHES